MTFGKEVWLVATYLLLVLTEVSHSKITSPILLIPGITGSQLTATDERFSFCNTFGQPATIWVEPIRLVLFKQCVRDELQLVVDDASVDRFRDTDGVTVAAAGFGTTEGVEFIIAGGKRNFGPYMNPMVEYFVERGYVRGESIRAAPYDWRLAADELEKRGYYANLKTLVEDMYNKNGKKKVTLVVHSMGGPVSHYFLTSFIDQAWKDTYINAWVTLSGAWSGGAVSLQTVAFGMEKFPDFLMFANDFFTDLLFSITRTFESIPWLFPKPSVFKDAVIVSTSSRNYTASDYEELFRNVGHPNGFKTFERVDAINRDFLAPNVPTYCYYGVNVDTPSKFNFDSELESTQGNNVMVPSSVDMGNGDGTVNIESSKVCKQWSSMSSKFTFREFDKVNHIGMINNNRVLADIALIVGAAPPSGHLSV